MKIEADLIKVRQEWDPSTNVQTNVIVLGVFGVVVEVPLSADQLQALIRRANQATEPAQRDFLDDELEGSSNEVTEDKEYGGDFIRDEDAPIKAPSMFREEPNLEEVLSSFAGPPETPSAPRAAPSATAQREAAIAAKRSSDPAQVRKDTKRVMRERASAAPVRRVAQDDMGNPIVDAKPEVRATPRPIGPEIVRTNAAAALETGNDGFEQG